MDVTAPPSSSPSSSVGPTTTALPSVIPSQAPSVSLQPSTSVSPTDECSLVYVTISSDYYPQEILWTISSVAEETTDVGGTTVFKQYSGDDDSLDLRETVDSVCLREGEYEFTTGINGGYYSLAWKGAVIMNGGWFQETRRFSIPPHKCWVVNIDIGHDNYPEETSWTVYRNASETGKDAMVVFERLFYHDHLDHSLDPPDTFESVCLPKGEYQ